MSRPAGVWRAHGFGRPTDVQDEEGSEERVQGSHWEVPRPCKVRTSVPSMFVWELSIMGLLPVGSIHSIFPVIMSMSAGLRPASSSSVGLMVFPDFRSSRHLRTIPILIALIVPYLHVPTRVTYFRCRLIATIGACNRLSRRSDSVDGAPGPPSSLGDLSRRHIYSIG